ncbi:MAG: hypothetical protein J7K26_03335 [Candidatus Aenigmarchaeota archaeon]|nr:hypothetical protein [Candidatus Aenigmarchaeota archaeon]
MRKGLTINFISAILIIVIFLGIGIYLLSSGNVDIKEAIFSGIGKDYCGNGVCGDNEDFMSCLKDCPFSPEENLLFPNLIRPNQVDFNLVSTFPINPELNDFIDWLNFPYINGGPSELSEDCYQCSQCKQCIDYNIFDDASSCESCYGCEEINGEIVCDTCLYCDQAKSDQYIYNTNNQRYDTNNYIDLTECYDCSLCSESDDISFNCEKCDYCINGINETPSTLTYSTCSYCDKQITSGKYYGCGGCKDRSLYETEEEYKGDVPYNLCWECDSCKACKEKTYPYICDEIAECIANWNGEPCEIRDGLTLNLNDMDDVYHNLADVIRKCEGYTIYRNLPFGGKQKLCTMKNIDLNIISTEENSLISTYNGCGYLPITSNDAYSHHLYFRPFSIFEQRESIPLIELFKISINNINQDECTFDLFICNSEMPASNEDDNILQIYNNIISIDPLEGWQRLYAKILTWDEVIEGQQPYIIGKHIKLDNIELSDTPIHLTNTNINDFEDRISNIIRMGLNDWSLVYRDNINLLEHFVNLMSLDEISSEELVQIASQKLFIPNSNKPWKYFTYTYNEEEHEYIFDPIEMIKINTNIRTKPSCSNDPTFQYLVDSTWHDIDPANIVHNFQITGYDDYTETFYFNGISISGFKIIDNGCGIWDISTTFIPNENIIEYRDIDYSKSPIIEFPNIIDIDIYITASELGNSMTYGDIKKEFIEYVTTVVVSKSGE